MNIKTHQSGFALATGLMFLLVLTLIAIVAMQGTKLELAMSTAVTRQEQAFEMTELSRVVARQSQAIAIEETGRVYSSRETNLPAFAIPCDGGGGQIGERPRKGIFGLGFNCSDEDCMRERVQNIDNIPNLWTISYPSCATSTTPAVFEGKGGLIKLSVDNAAGRDVQSGQDEVPVMITAFGRGATADGGSATNVAYFNVRTVR